VVRSSSQLFTTRRNTTFAELNSIDIPPSVWLAEPCSPSAIVGMDASSSMNSFAILIMPASWA
jgi:hypothetical protein